MECQNFGWVGERPTILVHTGCAFYEFQLMTDGATVCVDYNK
jgi:hypothetical protein